MRKDIQNAKDLKMDGVVVGVLDQNAQVDVARTRELVEFAHPLPVTFHRAFDETHSWRDPWKRSFKRGRSGCSTSAVLFESGGGLPTLTRLVREARDRSLLCPVGESLRPTWCELCEPRQFARYTRLCSPILEHNGGGRQSDSAD